MEVRGSALFANDFGMKGSKKSMKVFAPHAHRNHRTKQPIDHNQARLLISGANWLPNSTNFH
jgi:hypothetical protein